MFLDRLISIGKEFLKDSPSNLLRMTTDIFEEPRFLHSVAVIEGSLEEGFKVKSLPIMTLGQWAELQSKGRRKKVAKEFIPDYESALAFPYTVPKGGNPLNPQGKYGIPVYPFYPSKKQLDFKSYFHGRFALTIGLPRALVEVEITELAEIAQNLYRQIQDNSNEQGYSGHGLFVLLFPGQSGPYIYADSFKKGDPQYLKVGDSEIYQGKVILADLQAVLSCYIRGKLEEGKEKGVADHCSICGKKPVEAVSPYSRSWPLLAPTWHAPFPEDLKSRKEIGNLSDIVGALCQDCYIAMLIGIGVFKEVSGLVQKFITNELFVPHEIANDEARTKTLATQIRGAVLVTPEFQEEEGWIPEALETYRHKHGREGKKDLSLDAITGFEGVLPEEMQADDFRLTLVYYTQENADTQFRAIIEDVLPSTIFNLNQIFVGVLARMAELRRALELTLSKRFTCLPFLFLKAYGGSYLWKTMSQLLHKEPLDFEKFEKGAGLRINSIAKKLILGDKDAFFVLREEVFFYWLYREMLKEYFAFLKKGGSNMRSWKEILEMISKSAPSELEFEDPEDLGFAAGYLTRSFSKWYWGKLNKDFLKHRVLTFGSNLKPDDVWRMALGRFQEYAIKLDLNLPEDFRRRAAIVESEYRRLREKIDLGKDRFICAFWSGYLLAPLAQKEGPVEIQ